MRTAPLTFCLLTFLAWCCDAVADDKPRVVETSGDVTDAVCLAAMGGSLWVGTSGGVVKWRDGDIQKFDSTDGLPGNAVLDCIVHENALWVATSAGLARFDSTRRRFVQVESGRYLKLAAAGKKLVAAGGHKRLLILEGVSKKSLSIDLVPLALAGSRGGRLAAGGMDGVVYLDGRRLEIPSGEPVSSLSFCNERLRVISPSGGYEENDGELKRSPSLNGASAFTSECKSLNDPFFSNLKVSAAVEFHGRTFAATDEGVFAGDDDFEKLAVDGIPCGDRLSSLAWFDGTLWVGSFDRGLCKKTDSGWISFSGPSFLASDMINDMASDDEHLWVATRSGLTVVSRNGDFEILTEEQCKDNLKAACPWHAAVNGVTVDDVNGEVWVADLGAVHRVGKNRWKHFFKRAGIDTSSITRIAAREGRIAVGTAHAGVLIGGRKGAFEAVDDSSGLADNWVMDLDYDDKGGLLVATCTKGLSYLTDGKWVSWTAASGLVDDYTLSVKRIGEKIWVGTLSGLSVIDKGEIESFDASDGLAGNEIHDILSHDGKVYLATDGGLTVMEDQQR